MEKYSFWKFQWAELSTEGYTADNQFVYVKAKNSDGEILWTVKIDATGGAGDLMSRTWIAKTECTDTQIVVGTDGEHYKGGTSHNVFLHQIDRRGNIIRSIPEKYS